VRHRPVADLSALPTYGFGPRMTTWWGTIAFCALEGTGFALVVGSYLYLRFLNPVWPLSAPPPGLLWPTLNLALIVLSGIPNAWLKRRGQNEELRPVQIGLVIMSLFGLAAIALRVMEFTTLYVKWDQNAYGSLVWFLLGLHTTHIVTDVGDTLVLTALMFTRHARGKRFSDVEDNAVYWYFVIASWIPIYLLIYWLPRF
jgi:cytochrome c oxidase subunit 3